MQDLIILKALSNKKHFMGVHNSIPKDMLDPLSNEVLKLYDRYFMQYGYDSIDYNVLSTWLQINPSYSGRREELLRVINTIQQTDIDPEVLENVSNQIEELAFSGKLGNLLSKYNAGEDIDLTYEVELLAKKTRERMEILSNKKWASEDILQYLEADADDSGLQFDTFDILKQNLKGLHAGHNIAVVAPTDKGKTSLLCRIAVDMAKQAKNIDEYKDSCILYLVNEGLAETITPRIYCTALAVTRDKALQMARQGTITKAYEQVVGRRDCIRLVNIHGMNVAQVAKIIEAHKPYLVITDMTGRIRSNRSKGINELQELEDVWNSMRELSAIHKFIHIGTIQVSAEGMNNLFPPLTAMQWSKVGIQTTLDLCIMIGAVTDDESMVDMRGVSTPKNKLVRSGKRADNRFTVHFEPELNIWTTM